MDIRTDSLGNELRRSNTYEDCPYPCQMILPHDHSIIPTPQAMIEQKWYRQGFIDAVKAAYQYGLAKTRHAANAMEKHQ